VPDPIDFIYAVCKHIGEGSSAISPPSTGGVSVFSGVVLDLEGLLGTPVDVVTEAGLRSRIRERVLAEAVPL
jgi:hypothetical protein